MICSEKKKFSHVAEKIILTAFVVECFVKIIVKKGTARDSKGNVMGFGEIASRDNDRILEPIAERCYD